MRRTFPTVLPMRTCSDTGTWRARVGAQVARDAFGSALSAERLVIRAQTWALTRDGLGGAPSTYCSAHVLAPSANAEHKVLNRNRVITPFL